MHLDVLVEDMDGELLEASVIAPRLLTHKNFPNLLRMLLLP